jgi:hypothetical protein
VKTKGGGRFQKVDARQPVKGFLQVSSVAMPGTRSQSRHCCCHPVSGLQGESSLRALRYDQTGEDAQIVLEPWEHSIRLRGAEHTTRAPYHPHGDAYCPID